MAPSKRHCQGGLFRATESALVQFFQNFHALAPQFQPFPGRFSVDEAACYRSVLTPARIQNYYNPVTTNPTKFKFPSLKLPGNLIAPHYRRFRRPRR
jgi:hypothetical protein